MYAVMSPVGKQQHKHSGGYYLLMLALANAHTIIYIIVAAAISGSSNHMIFSESPAAPGIPVVYRTPEDKASNPERLNLDR